MALTLIAGSGVKIEGDYAIFERKRIPGIAADGINFMMAFSGITDSAGITLMALWKDTFMDENYYTLMQNNAGALIPWSRTIADPGNGVTAYYSLSVPFPENANICALKITGESENVLTIKAIGNTKSLR